MKLIKWLPNIGCLLVPLVGRASQPPKTLFTTLAMPPGGTLAPLPAPAHMQVSWPHRQLLALDPGTSMQGMRLL